MSFAQFEKISQKDSLLVKLIRYDEKRFIGIPTYRYYTFNDNLEQEKINFPQLYRNENILISTNFLTKSRLSKVGSLGLIIFAIAIPKQKVTNTNIGGYNATFRRPNYLNQIIAGGLLSFGVSLFKHGILLKLTSVLEYNSEIKYKYEIR
jgi:hypothetical protein